MSIKKNLEVLQNTIKSKDKKILVVDNAHHNLFDKNPDQKLIFNEILQFLNSN